MAGDAFLELRLTPAGGYDLDAAPPGPTYAGSERSVPPRTDIVDELVMTGDFEANLAWIIGVGRRRG